MESKFKTGETVEFKGNLVPETPFVINSSESRSHPITGLYTVYSLINTNKGINNLSVPEIGLQPYTPKEEIMPEFKVGDYVTIRKFKEDGPYKIAEISKSSAACIPIYRLKGNIPWLYEGDLELFQHNGTDAKGNPLHFTVDDLKVGMRIISHNRVIAIMAEHEGQLLPISAEDSVTCETALLFKYDGWSKMFRAAFVYDIPTNPHSILSHNAVGKLLWQYVPQKSKEEQDLEIEIATLEHGVRQTEKLIAVNKKKLESLRS